MVRSPLDKIRSEALGLSDPERAELAHDLVSSLDGAADADVANAWDMEISRRIAEVDSHTAALIDRQEFSQRLRKRLGR